MANADHLSNIGLHPACNPDPHVAISARLEAMAYQIARHQAAERMLRDQAEACGLNVFRVRAAVSSGRRRCNEQIEAGTLPLP